jgi:hypothetical protein
MQIGQSVQCVQFVGKNDCIHHNVNGFKGTRITFILEVWSLPCKRCRVDETDDSYSWFSTP